VTLSRLYRTSKVRRNIGTLPRQSTSGDWLKEKCLTYTSVMEHFFIKAIAICIFLVCNIADWAKTYLSMFCNYLDITNTSVNISDHYYGHLHITESLFKRSINAKPPQYDHQMNLTAQLNVSMFQSGHGILKKRADSVKESRINLSCDKFLNTKLYSKDNVLDTLALIVRIE